MADIAMCKGENCPKKETCYRYKATSNEYRQTYFTETPKGECEFYWELKKSQLPATKIASL